MLFNQLILSFAYLNHLIAQILILTIYFFYFLFLGVEFRHYLGALVLVNLIDVVLEGGEGFGLVIDGVD